MRVFFLTWCLMKLSHRSAGFLTAGFRWCPAVVQAAAEVWAVCSCPPQKEENSLLFLGHVVPLGGCYLDLAAQSLFGECKWEYDVCVCLLGFGLPLYWI